MPGMSAFGAIADIKNASLLLRTFLEHGLTEKLA
jgi:hypothetical protein